MSEAESKPTEVHENGNHNESVEEAHDPQFTPIVYLPEIHIPTLEEHEEVLIKLRAKLFRFDHSCDPAEWKERGTGEIKILHHPLRHTARVVMRRDRTLKLCANFLVGSWMQLKPNCGSDRAWVWSVNADYSDDEPKAELLAARFANADDAKKWFDAFEDAKKIALVTEELQRRDGADSDVSDEEEEEEETSETEGGKEEASKDEEAAEKDKSGEQVEPEEKKPASDDKTTEELTTEMSKVTVKEN